MDEYTRRPYNPVYAKRKTVIADYHAANKDKINKQRKARAAAFKKKERALKDAAVAVSPCVDVVSTICALAGFFDGDGCVHSGSRRLSFVSETEDVVDLFVGAFGGKKSFVAYHEWQVTGKEAVVVAGQLLPYAGIKREQLRIMGDQQVNETFFGKNELVVLKRTPPDINISSLSPQQIDQLIAGFFSADGHVTTRGYQPYVVFAQKFKPFVDTVFGHFKGGSTVSRHNPTCNGKKRNRDGDLFEAFTTTYSGDAARFLLQKIEPFVLTKRKRELCQLAAGITKGNFDETITKMAAINKHLKLVKSQ